MRTARPHIIVSRRSPQSKQINRGAKETLPTPCAQLFARPKRRWQNHRAADEAQWNHQRGEHLPRQAAEWWETILRGGNGQRSRSLCARKPPARDGSRNCWKRLPHAPGDRRSAVGKLMPGAPGSRPVERLPELPATAAVPRCGMPGAQVARAAARREGRRHAGAGRLRCPGVMDGA